MSNPFELRYKLIEIAKDYLDKSYEIQLSAYNKQLEFLKEQGKLNTEIWNSMMPEKYTIKDVVEKAQELYGFVDSKEGKR